MIHAANEYAGAIFFFDSDGYVSREILFTEFQAILDAYVPSLELAGRVHDAVYVELDSKLIVRRAVFFNIAFSADGFVDDSWALPLQELARSAAKGPDLGAGPIDLACASRCPIAHFQTFLWDPDLRNGRGQFGVLKSVVAQNRLGIEFLVDEEPTQTDKSARDDDALAEKITKGYEQELRNHMAQLLKEQRLRSKTIENESSRALESLKKEHSSRLNDLRLRIDEKDRLIEEEKQRNRILKETIDGQAEKIKGLREYFEHKLDQAQGSEHEQYLRLKENFDAELNATIESETKELKELLQMRDIELLYRNEQETQLHDEIARLRDENQELVSNSGNQLLHKLQQKGISFVTYQAGAGHITVPAAEIPAFMNNPIAFAAQHCGVSEALYLAWLEHYQAPICRHENEDGSLCGENIPRIAKPIDFIFEESDRCNEHKSINVAKSEAANEELTLGEQGNKTR